MHFLEVSGLRKSFGQSTSGVAGWGKPRRVVEVLKNIDFEIKQGETLGLVGESGSGKSTISRLIMHLMDYEGEILFEGVNLADLKQQQPAEFRKKRCDIQMIFQDPYASLNPTMTIYETIAEAVTARRGKVFAQQDRGVTLENRVKELMDQVSLKQDWAQRYPHEFSGGQRQRIAIARAIAAEPKLLIADEAVSALDVSVQAQVLNLLQELKQKLNLTLLFISHDLEVVRYISDRVMVIDQGNIVEVADSQTLFENPQHDYTKKLLAARRSLTLV